MPIAFANSRRNWSRWFTGSPSAAALQQATRTVPIVFVTVVDPVGSGFVDSAADFEAG